MIKDNEESVGENNMRKTTIFMNEETFSPYLHVEGGYVMPLELVNDSRVMNSENLESLYSLEDLETLQELKKLKIEFQNYNAPRLEDNPIETKLLLNKFKAMSKSISYIRFIDKVNDHVKTYTITESYSHNKIIEKFNSGDLILEIFDNLKHIINEEKLNDIGVLVLMVAPAYNDLTPSSKDIIKNKPKTLPNRLYCIKIRIEVK